MRYYAWMVGLLTLTMVGCANARLVSSTPTGGIVAVPDNTDSWPSHNMTKARELMSQQCPGGYSIVKQEEVVVGQTTTNNTQRDTNAVPITKGLTATQSTTRDTTQVQNQTEWRIWYQKNP